MGRLYVPKAPKKQSNYLCDSRIIARAIFGSLCASKNLVPAASRRISSMAPRDSKESTEINGSIHPGENGKEREAKNPRTASNSSLLDLPPEGVDAAIAAVGKIGKILYFVQGFHEEISTVEGIYGLGIRQEAQIKELETTITDLAFRKDYEMTRLQDENDLYRAEARQLERVRKELEQEQAGMDDTLKAIQSKMEAQKDIKIGETKQGYSDKLKTRVKQIKEEYDKKIQALETDNAGLKDTIKKLEEEKTQAQEKLKEQKKSFEVDKRSSQSHIMHLESELQQISAVSRVSPQTHEFYIKGFHQLWEGIRDVAANDFRFLPEDTRPLDSDAVRDRLSSISPIFKYPPLSTESAVATFLRACAIQNFLSTKLVSLIQRRYFAEPTALVEHKSGIRPMDSILDTISNVPAVTSSQQLSWRLTTIDKLERLGSHSPLARIDFSTKPSQDDIIKEIMDPLHYFQSPTDQQLRAKLTEIINRAIKLWSALRKDSCQVVFDYDPSAGDWQECDFVNDLATNGSRAADSRSEISVDQLPPKSFMLFPRITGSFDPDHASPHILHAGVALPHDSPAFREGLEEIRHIDQATKEFKRSLRRGSSAQSSPVMGKRLGDWPALHYGYN